MTDDIFMTLPLDDRPSQGGLDPDTLGNALIANSLVANDFILDLNHGLTVPWEMELPAPWSLPSRMFRFPIEVTDERPRRIGLVHPLMVDHPFVQHVQTALGIEIDPNGAPNPYGYTKRGLALWWHAVDLVSAGRWKDLLETERFTTPDDIARAVAFGLTYSPHDGKKRNGHISTPDARKVMAHLGSQEPEDREPLLRHFRRPSPLKEDKKAERWPINVTGNDPNGKAWGHIIGIEHGWFGYDRGGHLQWAELGRDRFRAVIGAQDGSHGDPMPEEREERISASEHPATKPLQLTLF